MGSTPTVTTFKSKIIRYAPYVESAHADLLSATQARTLAVVDDSPYAEYIPPEVDDAFFSTGYLLSSFPSLYDMFGKHMAGLDVEVIWSQVFENILRADEIDTMIAESADADELEMNSIPALSVLARNLNTVGSSTYVIGKARLESNQVMRRAEISAAVRFALLDNVNGEWSSYLNWQQSVARRYALTIRLYLDMKAQGDEDAYRYATEDILWPFKVMDFERAVIGVLQRAKFVKEQSIRPRSKVSKFMSIASDTFTGMSVGSMVGGWIGALVGAHIGWQTGVAKMLAEENNPDWWIGWFNPLGGMAATMTTDD